MLGEIVVDDQRVTAIIHEVLAHRRAGERRDVLHGGGIRRRGAHHRRILHCPVFLQFRHDLGHSSLLLPNGHIDAGDVLAALVQNRIDGDGGLAGLAVADDQLPLAAANGGKRVNGLNAGMQRHGDGLAVRDCRSVALDRPPLFGPDMALAVDGIAKRIHHAAEQRIPHRYAHHHAEAVYAAQAFDVFIPAENDAADAVGFDVKHHSLLAAGKLHNLAEHDVGNAIEPADAVGYGKHPPHLVFVVFHR